MPVTIKVNGSSNSVVHKGSMHFAKNTPPDVCKTPSPGGPVPIPYPVIISMSSDLLDGTTTVECDGNSTAIKGSQFMKCTGDEAGTAGGVVSSTFIKEATWILYSFDVKMDGANACRLSDKMKMNHGNTACLGGAQGPPVSVTELHKELKAIAKKCQKKVENDPKMKKKSCTVRGTHKHKCCQDELNKKKQANPGRYRNVKAEYQAKGYRLDVAVVQGSNVTKIFDYKFNCKGPPKMSARQRRNYWKAFKKVAVLIGGR